MTVCLLITSAPEIEKYLLGFQAKYGLADSIQLKSRVISAIWHEERGEYDVEVETPEGIRKDSCHVLINATGVLNKWKYRTQTLPLLQSLTSFQGQKSQVCIASRAICCTAHIGINLSSTRAKELLF